MRLDRLDLTRYGKFTGLNIDFGEVASGQPDFHIVYGPNEAGKSTAFAGFLDLLFGIETRSRFNFLHPYPTMRVGGSLQLAGGPRELIRIKRPQNSLLEASEQPISEGVILGELGGIDRDAYRLMFSLDDESLEAGGESILASKGDLGQLLFSASSGLADLSRSLGDLRTQAEGFYKKSARSGELSRLKVQFAALKEERERVDTMASQYAQLVERRDQAKTNYDVAIAGRGRTQARMGEIQRLLSALPRLADLRAHRDRLAPFADLPNAPADWREALPELQREEIEQSARSDSLNDEIARLAANLAELVVDEAGLALADRVDQLAGLRARFVTADEDLPDRRLHLRDSELAISGLLSRLGRPADPEPSHLILDATLVGALRDLIETRSGIEAAIDAAQTAQKQAMLGLDEANSRLIKAGGQEDDSNDGARIPSLAPVVAVLRTSDHAARSRLARRTRATQADALTDRMAELRPWTGTADELAAMIVPDASVSEGWRTATAAAQSQVDLQIQEIERLTTDGIRLNAEISAIGGAVGVVTDQEAAQVRAKREEAWASHRRALDAPSADMFERALRQDDEVANARLSHMSDLAALNRATQTLAVVESNLARARELQSKAESTLQSIRSEIAASFGAMTTALPSNMTVLQLEAWLGRRIRALEVMASIRAADRDLKEAEADAKDARARLTAALGASGVAYDTEADFEALMLAAEGAADRETELKSLRDAIVERQRDLKNRDLDVEKAVAAEGRWTASWSNACSNSWLGAGGVAPSFTAVRDILGVLGDLGPAVEKHASLADRIAKMEQDQSDYAAAVIAIAQDAGLSTSSAETLRLGQMIDERVQAARAVNAARLEKARTLEAARERQKTLVESLAINAKRKAQMTSFFGVDSLAEVAVKIQGIERKAELEEQIDAALRDILDAVRAPNLEEAEQTLEAAERTALEAEVAELEARFNDEDQRARDLFAAHSKAVDILDAVGGDDAVAKLEEQRRTTALEIEDGTLRYLRLRIGAAAADRALRAYRDQHRSSMMTRASDAFHTISRGAYKGLATQADKENEILIAQGSDGGSKIASELSRGTRFQLYLALRVAGYHEFVRTRRPLPFVADDIMETFDDFRAEEAFRLFMGMAEVGQVIYLTHHRHLCEIARHICPSVRIHSLG